MRLKKGFKSREQNNNIVYCEKKTDSSCSNAKMADGDDVRWERICKFVLQLFVFLERQSQRLEKTIMLIIKGAREDKQDLTTWVVGQGYMQQKV